jgi:hypothetical protein
VQLHLQSSNSIDSLQHEGDHAILPVFYAVGLLGFCQGQKDITRFSNCSDPSFQFSFDPVETIRSISNETRYIQEPDDVELYLDQHQFARYSIWAYLIGLVTTFFAAMLELFHPRLSRTKFLHVTFVIVGYFYHKLQYLILNQYKLSPLSIAAASVNLSLIYSLIDHGVQTNFRSFVTETSFGSLFIAAWSATGLSIAASVVWCICTSCCCI